MREEAKPTLEPNETTQRITNDIAGALRASIENLQTIAQTLQEAIENSACTMSELARHSSRQLTNGGTGSDGEALRRIEESTGRLRAVAETGTALARAFEELSREWFRFNQRRLTSNLDSFNALIGCRSTNEFLTIQSSLVVDNLNQSLKSFRRVAEIAIRMADEASMSLTVQPEKTTVQMETVAQPPRRASANA